jgi:hypothetical protein
MRVFLFSKRFLIPLFIVWILHLAFLGWELWYTYEDSLTGKSLPSSLIMEFLLFQLAGALLTTTFLIAFLIAIVFYSHYFIKKDKIISQQFFSVMNLIALGVISVTAFLYTSFAEPKSNLRSKAILAEIVYSRPGDKPTDINDRIRTSETRKSVTEMTLPELCHARDSLKSKYDINEEYDFSYLNNNQRQLDKIRFEIGKKISLPLNIVLFYFMGIFLAASFHKLSVVVPLIGSYIYLLISWFYIQRIFENLYYRKVLGVFFAAGGTAILFALLAIAWFFGLKNYGLFKNNILQDTSATIDF